MRAALAAVTLLAAAGCRHAPLRPIPSDRIAMFPIQNASGGNAPVPQLTKALETELSLRSGAIIPVSELDAVLARHRIRYTGGVDRPTARILRDELGVTAVLIPTLEQYVVDAPPKVAITIRLVDTSDAPEVLWADGVARSGDDSPGLLARGLVGNVAELERQVIEGVVRTTLRRIGDEGVGAYCGEAGRFGPRRVFRSPVLDDAGRRSIAILPFVNRTMRRSANDVLVGEFVAQLARSGKFEVLDPGVVREQLLAHRMVLEGGVSVDNAMALLDLLDADLILSGYVEVYEARADRGAPKVEFAAYLIDRQTAQLAWSSTSAGSGDDGVWFFGKGRVYSVVKLSCRMVEGVVREMAGKRPTLAAAE